MIRTIAKAVAYKRAPKASFMLLHPVKGGKMLVAAKGAKALLTSRAGATLTGLAIAIPTAAFLAGRLLTRS